MASVVAGRPLEVTIATTIDDGWVPHFATCVQSLAESRGTETVRILMLQGPGLSDRSVCDIGDLVRGRGLEFDVVKISVELVDSLPQTLIFSPMVWYRLLLPDLLPQLDRVLALDADTLVLQSVAPLYGLDLGDKLLAAVAQTGPSRQHLRNIGLDSGDPYFNAGVMLMNLEAMRADGFGPRAIALGHERYEDFTFAEQDAMNFLARGRWKLLPPRWNALSYLWLLPDDADDTYSALDRAVAKASPAVVHFEGSQTVKPWFYRSVHPLRHLYHGYRSQTGWPLHSLERKRLSGMLLRPLPIRTQYALVRAKLHLKGLKWSRP